MKKIILVSLFLYPLNFMGCFLGGEGDSATTPVKKDSLTTKPLSPGLYVADYAWIDSGKAGWESELQLDSNGSFRQFFIQNNEAAYEERGQWAQRDSDIQFQNRYAAEPYQGAFFDADYHKVDPDTNALRQITDTSFNRLEYTMYRQKPYWIPYTKRSYPPLHNGVYKFTETRSAPTPTDSNATAVFTDIVKLEGKSYTNNYLRHQNEIFQATGEWRQLGTFLVAEKFLVRGRIDTAGTFSPWDSLPGFIMFRIRQVSDTAFHIWTPASNSPLGGTWDPHIRVP